MNTAGHEEALVTSLLAPLQHVQPVTLGARRRKRRRRLLCYAIIAAGIVVTGVATADSLNPLSGIGVADHPRTPADALDDDVQAQLRAIRSAAA